MTTRVCALLLILGAIPHWAEDFVSIGVGIHVGIGF